jgi:Transposase DDE domain group 1
MSLPCSLASQPPNRASPTARLQLPLDKVGGNVSGKTITAAFEGGTLSSDGGVVILREIEKKLGLATALERCNSVSPNHAAKSRALTKV